MKVDLTRFRVTVAYFKIEDRPDGTKRVKATMCVSDNRDHGSGLTPLNRTLSIRGSASEGEQIEAGVKTLAELLEHEIWECLYVDGERYRDPHAPENIK